MKLETQLRIVDDALEFNEMPVAARKWLLTHKAALLMQMAANDNGEAA